MENRILSNSYIVTGDLLHQIGAAGSFDSNFEFPTRKLIINDYPIIFSFVYGCIDPSQFIAPLRDQIDFSLS